MIYGDNRYEVFVANEKTNDLRMNCVLSEKEFQYFSVNSLQIPELTISLQAGNGHFYSMAWGTLPGLRSRHIEKLQADEEDCVHDHIVAFVRGIEQAKRIARETSHMF